MALALVVEKLEGIPEAVKSMYVEREGKFHLDVDGVPDVSGLKSALDKEREAAKTAEKARRELEAKFKDVDPDKYREILSKFDGDEEAKLLRDGKMDEVLNRRTAKRDAEWAKKLEQAAQVAEAERKRTEKFLGRVLDDQIRASVNGKVHEKAVEDALFRARQIFTLDDNGNAVQKDSDGMVVIGKDGKTPFTPQEWIESMRDAAPHWFPATGSGSGANQNGQRSGHSKAELMSLPAKERMERGRRT